MNPWTLIGWVIIGCGGVWIVGWSVHAAVAFIRVSRRAATDTHRPLSTQPEVGQRWRWCGSTRRLLDVRPDGAVRIDGGRSPDDSDGPVSRALAGGDSGKAVNKDVSLLTPEELATIRERHRVAQPVVAEDGFHITVFTQEMARAQQLAPADIDALLAHIDALTPRWREGEPPEGSGWVWRRDEYGEQPVETRHDSDGRAGYYDGEGTSEPWGTARWCPIRRPE